MSEDKDVSSAKQFPTPKQWAKEEALWALGETTRADIAKRLGVSPTAVSIHMKKRGVVRHSRAEEHRQKIADEAAASTLADTQLAANRIRETKDEHYKMASGIAKLAWNEILTAKQEKKPIAVASANLKALDTAMTIMEKARKERWAVLGLDRPDAVDTTALPDLVVEELTADQIEKLRSREFNELEELDELEELSNQDEVPNQDQYEDQYED